GADRASRTRLSGAVSSTLPVAAATGVRFALQPGYGRNRLSVRPAIVGTALAITVLVTTTIFASSLRTLVARPALYGWNWDAMLRSGYGGYSNIAEGRARPLLDHDPDVAAWTGVSFLSTRIDGQAVPGLALDVHAPFGPPVLAGHALTAPDQVVLGAVTLAALHKHVGDMVAVAVATGPPRPLRIVGTATLPAIGVPTSVHLEIGIGAVMAATLAPPDTGFGAHDGPEAILVRFKPGRDRAGALQRLQGVGTRSSTPADGPATVVSVLRPAEIVNYQTLGTTPLLLGAGLAAGSTVALALTLLASVRHRRRDLALLKSLGFTRRQLGAVVSWQSTVAVSIGTVLAVPLGIMLGRWAWVLFARQAHVVPSAHVPVAALALIAVGAVVLANVIALVPGARAARTPTAGLLRNE
ncbi:MAG: hypothetical protein JWN46_2376, partial [Acidimicrobiales bacterium]|nr:hypothetical protein [Acidimicrobiales bacterium]